MHPFIKYPGGKSKEANLIIKYMPKSINLYVEPFVGGGSIFFEYNHHPSAINDKSRDLFLVYSLLKEQNAVFRKILEDFDKYWQILEEDDFKEHISDCEYLNLQYFKYQLVAFKKRKLRTIEKLEFDGKTLSSENLYELELTSRKAAFYNSIRLIYNNKGNNDILIAAAFYFLREYCYSSMFRFSKNGDFNVPYGGMSYNHKYLTNKIDYMFSEQMKSILDDCILSNDDFEIFLNNMSLTDNDFIFLDPPYDTEFSTYDNNPFDRNEQIRLCKYLSTTKAKWMLVIKKTDFIYDLYSKYYIREYDMNYMVSFKNRNQKEVKHLLITNYPLEV